MDQTAFADVFSIAGTPQKVPTWKVSLIYLFSRKRRRSCNTGASPGSCVRALHVSPWSDPVAYGVRGAVIALRREDAGGVQIEML